MREWHSRSGGITKKKEIGTGKGKKEKKDYHILSPVHDQQAGFYQF